MVRLLKVLAMLFIVILNRLCVWLIGTNWHMRIVHKVFPQVRSNREQQKTLCTGSEVANTCCNYPRSAYLWFSLNESLILCSVGQRLCVSMCYVHSK